MSLSDKAILDRWRHEPAPLLPLLHAFHDRDGHLTDDALRVIAEGLRTPLADLYGTVTFYHHFARFPAVSSQPRVCSGQICMFRGGRELLDELGPEGATPMPCAGRCDDPVAVLIGNKVFVGESKAELVSRASPLPPPNPGGPGLGDFEECVFSSIREPDRVSLAGYRRTGGYEGLARAVEGGDTDAFLADLEHSGLAGRGGAGFPTAVKWRAVRDAPNGPKTIVCNADEGEPGCFKDRVLMDHDPHAVLEGMALAAWATGATLGFIYLRYEYPDTHARLEDAIHEAVDAGLLGDDLAGTGRPFHVHVRRGAGAYICGEEGSLLNSLEGKHPFPRERPPFPVTHGFEDRPTVVNNVETLAAASHIARRGGDWYRGLGLDGKPGTKVISLSGDVRRPGNYEVPLGLPLQTLLHDWAGGPLEGRTIQAVTMAGLSGGFLAGEDLEVTLDEPSVRARKSMLGAGGIMVFDDRRDMVEVAHSCMEFFADESCGKCFPCRIGTQRLTERLGNQAGPEDLPTWTREVEDIGEVMKATSACGLGTAAPLVVDSLLRYFPEQVEAHVGSGVSFVPHHRGHTT